VHDVSRQLTVEELAELFGGRTRFVERLAETDSPLEHARDLLRSLPEEEQVEALNAHPRIGERHLSGASAREQGNEDDPAVLTELAYLNEVYEEKFGFRFLVFVNRRPKSEIVPVLQERLARSRDKELETAREELVAIAEDRWRQRSVDAP
jgi:2-oxo-4-hydroxy-4-carboxy--5-ureidoimidazoline (OHCU) decarboxylase